MHIFFSSAKKLFFICEIYASISILNFEKLNKFSVKMAIKNTCANIKLVRNQFISVFSVNLITLSYGCMLGWLSPYLPVYVSDESPLSSGKITLDELSWISACMSIGSFIGNFLIGYVSNNYGRKKCILLLSIPNLISIILVIFATNSYYLCASQLFSGITGGGSYVAIPLYVSEIAQPKIRGILSNFIVLSNNLGILAAFIMGIYLSPITTCEILLAFPFIFIISTLFLPETPQYLLKRNKIKEATKSLAYYRNCSELENNELFIEEFELLKLNASDSDKSEDKAGIKDLIKPLAIKGILIGIILTIMNPLCGCFSLTTYAATFFEKSGSDFDPNKSAVLLIVSKLISMYLSTIIIDKIGRKPLLIISTVGMIIGLAIMGIFSYLYIQNVNLSNYQFTPVIGMSLFIFSAGIAIIGMPMLILPEVLPKNVLSIGVAIATSSFSISSFIFLKIVPFLIHSIEVYGCMLIFILFSVLGLLFIIFVIPETRGKNLELDEDLQHEIN